MFLCSLTVRLIRTAISPPYTEARWVSNKPPKGTVGYEDAFRYTSLPWARDGDRNQLINYSINLEIELTSAHRLQTNLSH